MADLRLKSPSTLLISGPSSSGKTTLVREIMKRPHDVYDKKILQVVYCYSCYQPVFEEMKKEISIPIQFVEGITSDLKPPPRTLLVIDDLQDSSDLISKWFIKDSHHSDCDVIYLVQNLFSQNKGHRTCNLNSHALIAFKNPRDKLQISCLAKQICPSNNKFLMSAYEQSTVLAHGYLFINLQQTTSDVLRIRDSVFPLEANYYVDKKDYLPTNLNTL